MSLVDAYWSAPPVIRTWLTILVVESVLVQVAILPSHLLVLDTHYIFRLLPQVWRLVTSCCLSFGINILWNSYYIWTYGSYLERDCQRFNSKPGQFFVYILFVASLIMVSNVALLGTVMFTQPLFMALVYTWAQENRGRKVGFFIMTLDARYIPAAFLAMSFVMGGPSIALSEATGVLAAHLYDFLTVWWPQFGRGSDPLQVPRFIQRWFATPRPRTTTTAAGTAFRPRTEGASTGVSFTSGWGGRGPGRRLGSD